jgi:hypothetical protein
MTAERGSKEQNQIQETKPKKKKKKKKKLTRRKSESYGSKEQLRDK